MIFISRLLPLVFLVFSFSAGAEGLNLLKLQEIQSKTLMNGKILDLYDYGMSYKSLIKHNGSTNSDSYEVVHFSLIFPYQAFSLETAYEVQLVVESWQKQQSDWAVTQFLFKTSLEGEVLEYSKRHLIYGEEKYVKVNETVPTSKLEGQAVLQKTINEWP